MRFLFALGLLVPAASFLASCSSSSTPAASSAAGASGQAGAGGADGGSGGGVSTGGTGVGTGGVAAQGGAGGDAGGQAASGGHFGTCPELGDPNLTLFKHFGCGMCAQNNCDNELTAAFGSTWSSGDYTSGGACSDFMICVESCKCDSTCVTKQCSSSQDCTVVRMASDACMNQNCLLPCGSGGGGGNPSSSFGGAGG